jgi:endonuclease I
VIERQEAELMEAQSRIISLNGELRNCLEAWEKEKAAAIPSRKQTSKIEEDMSKFQSYAADLDRKTKEILNASTFKLKDEIMAKTSQSLVELLELLYRSKSRALNSATDVEKEDIVLEYDRMR